ncbi:SMP-30/gluconolactonase/LRE family protein [Algoriphagus lutimaris]|uniref:SMP-30/gluconolactonase/LRE family protein n=1 Tax=Algoriphagus lutimaris TaxID=613197 RepID=UPI00196A6B08|nr:SMP-30/gluconolactonase/LRE family protein [Algoriphagus lutimaris]MBN3522200.1 SMP-30/gluconolactonase/LRE family protein [Algoriphagus lutimaris]
MKKSLPIIFFSLFVLACNSPEKKMDSERMNSLVSNFETIGSIERLSGAMDVLIPVDSKIEVIASGFDWSEGPLWLEDQQALIFTDVPENKIWKWTASDSLEVYLEPSGYFGSETNKREPGANGLILDVDGKLMLCQHGARQVAKMVSDISEPSPVFEVLADTYEGKKFNSPNDLVKSENRNLFFTDPPYGLDEWDTKELEFQGVYQIDFMGNLTLQIDSLSRPNGIGLSPDGKKLYVAQSDPLKARYYAFDLDENENVSSGKMILDVSDLVGDANPGLPDGMAVHSSGNLFASGPGGILIISPNGDHLGTIKTERATSNCTFDTNEDYLYITADGELMRVKLK